MTKIHIIKGDIKLVDYVQKAKQELLKQLNMRGALLLRGFSISSLSEFQKVSEIICNRLFDYQYGSSPRKKLGGKIYSSTEYPDYRNIPLHNENSYTNRWPRKILFYCVIPPKQAGETPIANSHDIYNLIDSNLRNRFMKKGVMYTRNYGYGLDLSWQQAFQTESKHEVAKFCQENNIQYQWNEDKLHTQQVCQAVLKHPEHHFNVWFNQAHLFHQSANDPELQEFFKDTDPMALPRNAFYGDGQPFQSKDLQKIREAYKRAEITFPWQRGDLLILDNILYCHGRKLFEGERKIVVSMGE